MDAPVRGEELRCVVHAHGEHVTDAVAAMRDGELPHRQRCPPQAPPGHLDVRQEAHLDRLHAPCPSQASQRPPAVLNEKRPGP